MCLRVGCRGCLTPSLSLFQESEPISRYLHVEVGTELRQRLAKMGMDMLLKMVGTWLGLQVKVVFLQKLFSLDNKTVWLKRQPICFLPVPGLGKAWAAHIPAWAVTQGSATAEGPSACTQRTGLCTSVSLCLGHPLIHPTNVHILPKYLKLYHY